MNGARANEVDRLIAAARRAGAGSAKGRSLIQLAEAQWHRAAALRGCPGRRRSALLQAEAYARAALLASGGPSAMAIPQD